MYLNLNVSYANTLWCLAFGMFLCCYYCFGVRACVCVCASCRVDNAFYAKGFFHLFCVYSTRMYVLVFAFELYHQIIQHRQHFSSFKDKSLAFTLEFSHRANCCPNYFCFLRFLLFDIWCEHSCNFGEHFYDYYAFWCLNLMKIA